MDTLFVRPLLLQAESLPEGRVFALDGQTLIAILIQMVNLALLVFVLYKLLYGPAKQLLTARSERIGNLFKEAESREAEAQAVKADYQARLDAIEAERAQILDQAQQEAERERDRILAEAEEEAAQVRAQASQGLEAERRLLQDSTRDYVIELSAVMAEKAMKESVDSDRQAGFYEEGLRELEGAGWKES